jgi:hypothetical protein
MKKLFLSSIIAMGFSIVPTPSNAQFLKSLGKKMAGTSPLPPS